MENNSFKKLIEVTTYEIFCIHLTFFFVESFRKFDYGYKENLMLYGSTQPPKYRLERIKVPIAIFYSENDLLADYAVSFTFMTLLCFNFMTILIL